MPNKEINTEEVIQKLDELVKKAESLRRKAVSWKGTEKGVKFIYKKRETLLVEARRLRNLLHEKGHPIPC